MTEQEIDKLAKEAAEALELEWAIGASSYEGEWDSADAEDIAKVLKPFLVRAARGDSFGQGRVERD